MCTVFVNVNANFKRFVFAVVECTSIGSSVQRCVVVVAPLSHSSITKLNIWALKRYLIGKRINFDAFVLTRIILKIK